MLIYDVWFIFFPILILTCDVNEVLFIILVQYNFYVFLCLKFLCICIWSSIMFSLYITVHHLRECVVNWCKWRTVYNVECFKFRS